MYLKSNVGALRLWGAGVAALAAGFLFAAPAGADTVHPKDDAYVDLKTDQLAKKFGRNTKLLIRSSSKGTQVFLRFDLTSLPAGTVVEQGLLRLYVASVAAPGEIEVHLVDVAQPWTENGIKGNNRPLLTTLLDTIAVAKSNKRNFITIDLTAEVQDWLATPADNFGIVLKPVRATGVEAVFDSKENTGTGHEPELELVLSAEGTAGSVPTNAVMAFAQTNCPAGWSEYTAARGRYLVGRPAGGSLGSTVGTALTNLQNRAVGQHNHAVNPPSTNTTTIGNHSHSYFDDDPFYITDNIFSALNANRTYSSGQNQDSRNTGSAGSHSHSVNIPNFNSANSGTVSGTNAPYIQLTMCRKN